MQKTIFALGSKIIPIFLLLNARDAFAIGRINIAPYASLSSSKSIKPKLGKNANSSEEIVTQRQTYGLKVDIRLSKLFLFTASAGTNKVDTTKKASAMRDEFKEIDFSKDANVDTSAQNADYRYREEQRLANLEISIMPSLVQGRLWGKIGLGARARQRLIDITDNITNNNKSIHDKIRYDALGSAGVQLRLFHSLNAGIEYKFYFIKFPKTEPHQQEVAINFGVQI